MGVSGCGKSAIANHISQQYAAPFIECDDLHTAQAKQKMAQGTPLNDLDRQPWLENIVSAANEKLNQQNIVVVTCSALKQVYRDTLRKITAQVHFIHLAISEAVAFQRVAQRQSHFFPKDMVASQFATLQVPALDEGNILSIDASAALIEVCNTANTYVQKFVKE